MSSGFNTDGMFCVPERESQVENCLESIECAIAFDVRCWSEDRRSAWIYGIVFGWEDDEYSEEIKRRFRWDDVDISRLKMLHKQWEALKRIDLMAVSAAGSADNDTLIPGA